MTDNEAKALALISVHNIVAKDVAEEKQRQHIQQSMMSDDEVQNIISGVMRARNFQPVPEDVLMKIIQRAMHIRFQAACVDLAAKGLANVDLDDSEPTVELMFCTRTDLDEPVKEALQDSMRKEL